ncbi:hypothetical protein NST11_01265 [Caldifermentibacillus hisashii]|nr:hypothetical protein [Caldibacillus thermoamylovorans]MCM3477983.1 hypothetical protein [Caldibacillus thermoamylovorans]
MTTRLVLVTILSWETANFDDEICSRRHFGARNTHFWRRALVLVTVFGRETSFFGDEACSRRHFGARNTQF